MVAALATPALTSCALIAGLSPHTSAKGQRYRAEDQPLAQTADERLRQSCVTASAGSGVSGATWPRAITKDATLVSERNENFPVLNAEAREAASAVRKVIPDASKHSLLVLAAYSENQFRQWAPKARLSVNAVTITRAGCLPYIVLAPATSSAPARSDARETLVHEATHALSVAPQAPARPLWVAEGMAEFVGQGAVALPGHPSAAMKPQIPSDADFTSPDATRAALAYDAAWQFYVFLAQTHTRDVVVDFYREAVSTTTELDALLTSKFGANQAELQKRFTAWYAARG